VTLRQRLSYAVKLSVSHALYYVGLLQLWQRVVMRRKAVVLMYHRVLTAEQRERSASHPALIVDPETFARHMRLLKRRFVALTADEFVERMEQNRPFPDSACLITFDDGWHDNLTNALPVLERHGLPALVFLPVNYIGRERLFWQESLVHLLIRMLAVLRTEPERRARFAELLAPHGLGHTLDISDASPRAGLIEAMGTQKRFDRRVIEALRASLAAELQVREGELTNVDGFIDWEEARAMQARGITFGGHGAEHLLLTQASPGEVEAEIRTSRAVLAERLGGSDRMTFSYPNGYWTPDVAAVVRQEGYRVGFVTQRGFVDSSDDRFTVRRLNVHEAVTSTAPMFLARVVGLL
jgi:peptidoglycan/xylan/chitin deacetylase (PgdA/CDA1 family)